MVVIDSMFLYHLFCRSWPEKWDIDIDGTRGCRHLCTLVLVVQENFFFLTAFWWKVFKSSLDPYFHSSIIEFRIEKKMHTKTVIDLSRDTVGFSCFLGRDWKGVNRNLIVCSKVATGDLNMKFRSKFNHGFINRNCLHCAILKACKGRDMQIFPSKYSKWDFKDFENVQVQHEIN